MTFFTSLLTGAGRVAKPIAKTAIGGTFGRMALGAAVGGGIAAMRTDYNDTSDVIGNIARGAFLGAAVGGLSRLVTPSVKFGTRTVQNLESGLIGPRLAGGEFLSESIGPRMKGGGFFSTHQATTMNVSGMPLGLRAAGGLGKRLGSWAVNMPGLKEAMELRRLDIARGRSEASILGRRMKAGRKVVEPVLGPMNQRETQARSFVHQLRNSPLAAGVGKLGLPLAYPAVAVGLAGSIWGLSQLEFDQQRSPARNQSVRGAITNIDIAGENEMIQRMNNGVSPMGNVTGGSSLRADKLMQSTMGLVQGMHRGRHS